MTIKGLQKTTLLDFPGKVACTVFTAGCNFRCPFCHNASLVTRPDDVEEISEESFFTYISKRKGILDGVCITGGEPLLSHGIEDFIRRIKQTGLLVKLDTNGAYPEKLKALLDEGLLDYVAMDVKNSHEKYAQTVGLKAFPEKIEESIRLIMEKAPDYEFRTTVVKELHETQDIVNITEMIKGAKRYFLQTYVDSGDILCEGFSAYDAQKMLEMLEISRKNLPCTILRGIDN
jgi:pyruvate formate lyase activating enzyme